MYRLLLTVALSASAFKLSSATAKLTWADTKYMIVFGDSYTTNGYNISAGIDSSVPGFTSSNGPNWVGFLGMSTVRLVVRRLFTDRIESTYNVTDTRVFNLAYGGATIDSALVEPYLPTVL